MTKRFALIPAEREKECTHEHVRYRGEVPCTGPRVCMMCGEIMPEKDSGLDSAEADQIARELWQDVRRIMA